MPKIPIPDQWRENYPHFKGNPKHLRFGYIFIVTMGLITFGLSCVWYYEYDKDTVTKIVFDFEADPDWECEAIGIYSGNWRFVNEATLSANLSSDLKMGFIDLASAEPVQSATIDAFNFTAYRFVSADNIASQEEKNTFQISKGNAPTLHDCLSTFEEKSCAALTINTSHVIDVKLYKFTYSVSIEHAYPFGNGEVFEDYIDFSDLNLYKNASAEDVFSQMLHMENTNTFFESFVDGEHWLVTDTTDLCTIIQNGVSNNEVAWGVKMEWKSLMPGISSLNNIYWYPWGQINAAPDPDVKNTFYSNITSVDINVDCEMIAYDYCIMNATDQFSFPNTDDLPRKTLMFSADDEEQQYLLLSSELGETCGDRWNSVCAKHYDIEGLCNELVTAPYTCTSVQRKTFIGIVSLAFASSQLVNTILIVILGAIFSRISKSRWEHGHAPWENFKNEITKHLEMTTTKEDKVEDKLTVDDEQTNANIQMESDDGTAAT